MRKVLAVSLVAVMAIAVTAPLIQAGEDEGGKEQKTCPVMGGEINKDLYVDYEGKRIYVCCAGCISAVKQDPEKYIEKLEAKGVELEKVDEGKASASEEGNEHPEHPQ